MMIACSRSFGQMIGLFWRKPIKEASFIFGTDKESPLLTLAGDHCISLLFSSFLWVEEDLFLGDSRGV